MLDIIKQTLQIEANSLLEAKIDENYNKAIDLILSIKGKLIVIGVGKSGLVGAKIAATLASTGTSSFFIHPTEAMHGDLGMIGKDDAVLAISYSGESEELIQIIPHLKRFDIPLIGMAKSKDTTLGKYSDIFLNIYVKQEACRLGVAPTSSTTLTMALGDALAVALMEKRGFTKEDFASFHPGGSLGKQLFVKVKDLARVKNLPIIDIKATLKEAILVMSEGKLGNVLITKNKKLVAILSDGDLRRGMLKDNFSLDDKAINWANKSPKVCKDSEMLASDALKLIEKYKIQLLVIVKNEKIEGVLHIHDLVEAGIK
jgi:arabinose-5-phosphate isomerase